MSMHVYHIACVAIVVVSSITTTDALQHFASSVYSSQYTDMSQTPTSFLTTLCHTVFTDRGISKKQSMPYKLRREQYNLGHPIPYNSRHRDVLDIRHIESRFDIPEFLVANNLYGAGVELGVRLGSFSKYILKHSKLSQLLSVDMWKRGEHGAAEMLAAKCTLAEFGNRSISVRGLFEEIVPFVPEESLDFVYIDGYAGGGEEGGRTLQHWYSKLKPGGLFAGHDYDAAWPKVVSAVDAFVHNLNKAGSKLILHVTTEKTPGYSDRYTSWLLMKPVRVKGNVQQTVTS